MPKRKGTYTKRAAPFKAAKTSNAKRAAAIGAALAARYPFESYGRTYVPKGTYLDQAGASYKAATADQRAWRKSNNYHGVGGFWGDAWSGIKRFGKAHGAKALGAIGGMIGGPAGAMAGASYGKAMGLGRYDMGGVGAYGGVSRNAIVHGGSEDDMSIANVNPSMSDDSGDVILSHSEFIGNVVATATLPAGATTTQSTFQNSVYPINPGLQGSFPFLCQLAANFTMYRLEGVIYQYKPTSGEGGGSTNQLGKIIMATDYDPMALPFINSVQMENYQYSQSTKPSLAARHGVECEPSQGVTDMKYVRTGTSNRDKSFTDLGLFQIATEGIPVVGAAGTTVNTNIGELWVSYKVRLSRANLYSSLLGYSIRQDIFDLTVPAQAVGLNTLVAPGSIVIANNITPNNIGCTYRLRQGGGTYPDTITIDFPVSQILGVYKITIFSASLQPDAAANYVAWLPLIPNAATSATSTDKTQWGCTFLPFRNANNQAATKPSVDLVTGLPIWADATVVSGAPGMCITASETSNTFGNTQTVTYFAINSPTTTVARLCMGTFNFLTGTYTVNTVAPNFFNTFTANTTLRIAIEQVNAEISN